MPGANRAVEITPCVTEVKPLTAPTAAGGVPVDVPWPPGAGPVTPAQALGFAPHPV